MSAQLAQSPQSASTGTNDNQLAVSLRLLLSLYAVIPVCILLQVLDSIFWNGYLQDVLPSSPKSFVLFQVLFGTPHILASAILLTSNKEYFKHFQSRILYMSLAIGLFFGVGNFVLPYSFLYILVASWTVFHVLKQQHGIARGICKLSNTQFNVQLWLSIFAGIFVYLGIFMKNSLSLEQAVYVKYIAILCCSALLLSTLVVQRFVHDTFGKTFLWANTLLVLSSFYLYIQEYYFLAILVPRLVHDATAYVFYVCHDYNRHHVQPQNAIYRIAKKINIHIFVVLPLISFTLATVLQLYGDEMFNVIMQFLFGVEIRKAITLGLLGYFALMHYYTEAFTWKGDSPYRRYIRFSK